MSPASLFILFNISSSRSSVGIFDGSKHKPLYSPGFVSVSVKVIPLIEFAVWFSKFIFGFKKFSNLYDYLKKFHTIIDNPINA